MNILIAGANGGIAEAIGAELNRRPHSIASISRGAKPSWSHSHLQANLASAPAVSAIADWLKEISFEPDIVIQCSGLLHDEQTRPEKTLMQMSESWLMENISVNLVTHIHLAQALNPLLKAKKILHWVSLSAMVGSISDNHLGGWHSYRISKAGLNMFIRNLHLEWTRKSPQSIVVALHPGTTDTPLSTPFQANIADGKLYSAELTGRRLSDVVENLQQNQSGHLLHWDGSTIPF